MKIDIILTKFYSDPILGSFFLNRKFYSDQKVVAEPVDESSEDKDVEEFVDENGLAMKMEEPEWRIEAEKISDFMMCFLDLVKVLGEDLIYELKRLDKSIDIKHKRSFYLNFLKLLKNKRAVDSGITNLSRMKIQGSYAPIFNITGPDAEEQYERRRVELSEQIYKTINVVISYVERLTNPTYSFDFDLIGEHVDTPMHPFVWCGDTTQLAELIFFLSARGWLKVNSNIEDTKNLATALSNIFVSLKGAVPQDISPSTFQSYFVKLKLKDINEMTDEKIFKLPSPKLKFYNDEENPNPFIGILNRTDQLS